MKTQRKDKHAALLVIAASITLAAASPARAQEAQAEAEGDATQEAAVLEAGAETDESDIGFDAAVKVGGTFHTMFNELSPFVTVEIEGGITFLSGRVELDLGIAWAQPPAEGSGSDPRFDDEYFEWELSQDFFAFSILARYRFLEMGKLLNVYAGGGPRLFLLRTVTNGKANGEDLGETRQYETRFGGAIVAGPELHVGPGALSVEFALALGDLNGLVTGDTSSSALDVLLGYRFLF